MRKMCYVVRRYDCSLDINDDNYIGAEFEMDVYDELKDLCDSYDHIVLVLKHSKFMFNFSLDDGSLDIENDGSMEDYYVVQSYMNNCGERYAFFYYQIMANLIEGISMVHSPVTAYFCLEREDAEKVYDEILVFKTKSEKEKEDKRKKAKKLEGTFEMIYIPDEEYHEHQFINFCKKYNLDPELKDYVLRTTTFDEYGGRKVYIKDQFFSVPLIGLYEFIDGLKVKDDIIEAKYGPAHLYIYKFDPKKYSKLILLK